MSDEWFKSFDTYLCIRCNRPIKIGYYICPKCGAKQTSDKSFGATLFLFIMFPGFHRFYVGRGLSAIFFIFTMGGIGIWWIKDLITILSGKFVDRNRLPIMRKKKNPYWY